ncbi:MAG: hypothetical protein HYU78_00010 [Rhodocyclales bacterium]|nr:hypothetical protein [Rhodocyclales bacterium]
MRRSLANVIAVIGLFVYWSVHAVAIMSSLFPIARQAIKFGVLAKEHLELPIVGLFMAPILFLLDFGTLLEVTTRLFYSCIGLLLTASLLGGGSGILIRMSDPYGVVSLGYVFSRSCVLAALSCIPIALLYPRFASSYMALSIPALAITSLAFAATLRIVAYPKSVHADNEA